MAEKSKKEQKIIFSSFVKPIVSEEKDKYLALASLDQLKQFVPNIDVKKNIDLLPIAFNACNVNRANKNFDGITTETALDIYNNFIYKYIDIEHDRNKMIGVIVSAGFTEFGSDKPLKPEEVKGSTKPFNIVLGALIWRLACPELANKIEESNDPSSEYYQKISASWELGFFDYQIAELEGVNRNFESATFIKDPTEIEKLEKCLKAYGGTGKSPDGKILVRVPIGEVKALGVGLTDSPAGDVQGIATSKANVIIQSEQTDATTVTITNNPVTLEPINITITPQNVTITSETTTITENSNANTNNLDKTEKNGVNADSPIMKITSVKDITDESLKTMKASEISEFIEEQLKKASEEYSKEKTSVAQALEKAKKDYETLVAENNSNKEALSTTKKSVEDLQKKLEQLENNAKAAEAQTKFDERMTWLTDTYSIEDAIAAVVTNKIKGMSDEAFAEYQKELAVMLKGKEKAAAATVVSTASTTTETTVTVEDALENGKPVDTAPPATVAPVPTKQEQWAAAFADTEWEVKRGRK